MMFPNINYIGNKEKISDWIIDNIPEDAISIFDAFSGGSSVSYAAKRKGLQVFSNDILAINYQIAKALIENNGIILNDDDVDLIFEGEPIYGYMHDHYSNVFYFPEECCQLDLIRDNIEKIDNQYKKALAYALIRRAMIRKMPYSRFTINWDKISQLRDEDYSYRVYKRRRHYHNQSFEFHFRDNLEEYNNAVFDNGKDNKAYNEDIFKAINHIHADVIYLDPPYVGTMNNYKGFYGPIDELISGQQLESFEHSFTEKINAVEIFDSLFSRLSNYKYLMLSYNNVANPTRDQMKSILEKYAYDIRLLEKPHKYKVTGKDKKNSSIEYLFIAKLK